MLFIFIEHDILAEVVHISVDSDTDVAAPFCVGKDLFMPSLLCTDNGGEHHKACALFHRHYLIYYLIYALSAYLLTADGAMGYTYSCV